MSNEGLIPYIEDEKTEKRLKELEERLLDTQIELARTKKRVRELEKREGISFEW